VFDPQTRQVTLELSVEDPNGYFIPNLRPENFAVFENGERQKNVSVDVTHAIVSVAVLVEGGGRYQELNKMLESEVPVSTAPLRDALIPGDRAALFSYTDTVKTLVDFGASPDQLDSALRAFDPSGFSESRLYDAVLTLLNRMRSITDRKAVLLISTGLDTFSRTTFDDVVAQAEHADTPVYCIGLGGIVRRMLIAQTGPLAKVDWNRADTQLKTLARATDGRAYLRETDLGIRSVYDDVMEHLRVRYVITYGAPNAEPGSKRTVRVALVEARTGGPLRVVDASGQPIVARVSAEAEYSR
jgi:VWFA-related protein